MHLLISLVYFQRATKTFELQLFLICQASLKKVCGELIGFSDFLAAHSVSS